MIVINLERAQERRERMVKQLKDLPFDFTILDAVDGQKLTEDEKDKKISLDKGYRYGELFAPGEIACTMSHIKALELAKENDWPYVLVLEDDVVLAEDFVKRVKFLFRILPEDWEHVYLSGVPRTVAYAIRYNANLSFLNVVPSPIIDCIPITLIRNTAYDKIINYLNKFETTTDDSIIAMIFRYNTLKSYTYFPFCAYVQDDFTYIWNEPVTRPHKSQWYFKNKI